MTAANALLQAVTARLLGDADLVELIGADGIHDRLLTRIPMPYVVIAGLQSDDFSTSTEAGEEHLLTLEIWSSGQGQREAQVIAGHVHRLLHDAALSLVGAVLVSLLHRSTRARRVQKTRAHGVEMVFRAVTE
ncbi:DUF3168 domain-containing protein [Rhizobium sp. LjRoot30]|uniref:DUF3168 domain-containing protein n=1 Tax=Rhizobium sp. LjRoot30 TaxID=3342320 RepID=UPI003ECCCEB8